MCLLGIVVIAWIAAGLLTAKFLSINHLDDRGNND